MSADWRNGDKVIVTGQGFHEEPDKRRLPEPSSPAIEKYIKIGLNEIPERKARLELIVFPPEVSTLIQIINPEYIPEYCESTMTAARRGTDCTILRLDGIDMPFPEDPQNTFRVFLLFFVHLLLVPLGLRSGGAVPHADTPFRLAFHRQ